MWPCDGETSRTAVEKQAKQAFEADVIYNITAQAELSMNTN